MAPAEMCVRGGGGKPKKRPRKEKKGSSYRKKAPHMEISFSFPGWGGVEDKRLLPPPSCGSGKE